MSGGVAYVLDQTGDFRGKCNQEQIILDQVGDEEELKTVHNMIERHVQYTNSPFGKRILDDWVHLKEKLVRVIPKDYLEMQERIHHYEASGLSKYKAALAAFEEGKKAVNQIKDGG
jgi:glutamate synthase domain-containing protein 3